MATFKQRTSNYDTHKVYSYQYCFLLLVPASLFPPCCHSHIQAAGSPQRSQRGGREGRWEPSHHRGYDLGELGLGQGTDSKY